MSKQMKFALLPAAIAGALLSGNALAGTEACIEVFKTTENAYAEHDVLYTGASCVYGSASGTTATTLRANDPADIAYELTKNFDYSLEALSNVTGRETETLNAVYVPTTDIPPASRLTFNLEGATFEGNSDLIHLVGYFDTTGDGVANEYIAVASTDGAVDGESEITFLVKSGVTVGAGSRLVLSLTNQPSVAGDIVTPGINIANPEQCTTNDAVTLGVSKAVTDFGFSIEGGATKVPSTLVDVEKQFALAQYSDNTVHADVNAESPSYRTEFVWDQDDNGDWVNQTTVTSLVWETFLVDNTATLDQIIEFHADDELHLSITPSSSLNGQMTFATYQADVGAATAKDASQPDHFDVNATALNIREAASTHVLLNNGDTNIWYDADTAFIDGQTNTPIAFELANRNVSGSFTPMTFNYDVDVDFGLFFDDTTRQDHNFCETRTPFDVGVNGAVLKVPYAYKTDKNWVRITNEHTTEAEVSVEVFDENYAEGDKRVFIIGNVGADDSTVFKADEIIAQYEAEVGRESSNRVSMTFTVTAPQDLVHGVSVQAIPGGVDRVMPVLDQNAWNQ